MDTYIIASAILILIITQFIYLWRSYHQKLLSRNKLLISSSLIIVIILTLFISPYRTFYTNNNTIFLGIDRFAFNNIYYYFVFLLFLIAFAYPRYHVYLKKYGGKKDSEKVDVFLNRIFSSEKFLTAFSTSLPTGKEDKELGLDYIPFLLQNIENKRKRFQLNVEGFLYTIIILGIFFIALVIYFGSILLNDSSIGISKTVKELKNNLAISDLNYSKSIQAKNINNVEQLKENYNLDLKKIQKNNLLDSTSESYGYIAKFNRVIEKFNADDNLKEFELSIDSLKNNYFDQDKYPFSAERVIDNINYIHDALAKYNYSNEIINKNILVATKKSIELLPKIEQEIEKPSNQTNELIKRLVLSIVIASFFLAILRYIARLYKENHNLMIQAENDDLSIRKFYVALKNTDKNQEERKIVIESFLKRFEPPNKNDPSNPNLNKEESNLLKDLLNNITKKL